jgi:hypothetical protein
MEIIQFMLEILFSLELLVILWRQKWHCSVGAEGLSFQLKWSGRKADHLPLPSVEIKNKWSQARNQKGPTGLQPFKKKLKNTL